MIYNWLNNRRLLDVNKFKSKPCLSGFLIEFALVLVVLTLIPQNSAVVVVRYGIWIWGGLTRKSVVLKDCLQDLQNYANYVVALSEL
jgi:hypothetical protein